MKFKVFTNCSCIAPNTPTLETILNATQGEVLNTSTTASPIWLESSATPGSCPIDCTQKFYIFLAVVCLLKFSGATGRASNFLVSVRYKEIYGYLSIFCAKYILKTYSRCVEERDKAVAMGFGIMIMSLFAFIPSPILFGVILGKRVTYNTKLNNTFIILAIIQHCYLYEATIMKHVFCCR